VAPGGFKVVEDGCVDDDWLRLPDWPRGVLPALEDWLRTPPAPRSRSGASLSFTA